MNDRPKWILAPTPCQWCKDGKSRTHWHSFRGFNDNGDPKIGMIISFSDPSGWSETYTTTEEAKECKSR